MGIYEPIETGSRSRRTFSAAGRILGALKLDGPCPTFRPAERNLAPERQLAFVFRAERTTAAYAFPQPTA